MLLLGLRLGLLTLLGVVVWIVSTAFALSPEEHAAALEKPQMLIEVAQRRALLRACRCDRSLHPAEVPPLMAAAVVAVEDKRFRRHRGFDARGIAAALVSAVTLGARPRGGSTIPQQLAKNVFTGDYPDARRKIAEAAHAWRIERARDKDDILRLYLSRAPFGTVAGQDVSGLRQAARVWFGTTPRRLSPAQVALLTGMLRSPVLYDPVRRPVAAAARAETVARLMREAGLEAPSRAQIDAALPARARPPWRDRYVEDAVLRHVEGSDLPDGWYRLTLTLDPIAQYQARRVVAAELSGRPRGAARAALVTVDERGHLVAMLGGTDYRRSQFNIALLGERQAASTAKVATYLAAFEAGWTAEDLVIDDPAALTHRFRPRNADGRYRGAISLGACLAGSRNVCTVWLAEQVGFEAVERVARALGLVRAGAAGEAIVLGAEETTPVDVAMAFAAIAGDGRRRGPRLVLHAMGPYGRVIPLDEAQAARPVASRGTLQRLREALRVVVEDGTARRADVAGLAVAGKTGTSQENRDAWFVGFLRDEETGATRTTAVWVGPREGGRMSDVEGGGLPAGIFARYTRNLAERFEDAMAGVPEPRR